MLVYNSWKFLFLTLVSLCSTVQNVQKLTNQDFYRVWLCLLVLFLTENFGKTISGFKKARVTTGHVYELEGMEIKGINPKSGNLRT